MTPGMEDLKCGHAAEQEVAGRVPADFREKEHQEESQSLVDMCSQVES